jgi:hypothetical protein
VSRTTSSNVASVAAGEVTTGPGTVVAGVVVVVAAAVVVVDVVAGDDVVVGATAAATVVGAAAVVVGLLTVVVGMVTVVVVWATVVTGATASVTGGGAVAAGAGGAAWALSVIRRPSAGSGYDDSGNVEAGSEPPAPATDAGCVGGAIADPFAASASDRPAPPPPAHQTAAATHRKASASTSPTTTYRPVRSSFQSPRRTNRASVVITGMIWVSALDRDPGSLTRRLYHCHRAAKLRAEGLVRGRRG